jgi:hypothetical protein
MLISSFLNQNVIPFAFNQASIGAVGGCFPATLPARYT